MTLALDKNRKGIAFGVISFILLMTLLRWIYPERPIDYIGWKALFDSFFALSLLAFTLLFSGGLGLKVVRRMKLSEFTQLEKIIFGEAIGLGVLAYGVFALGLMGKFVNWAFIFWLLIIGFISWQEWSKVLLNIPQNIKNTITTTNSLGLWKKILLIVFGIILFLSAMQALTPPTDPDGLIHHLQVQKMFLEAQRVYAIPDIFFSSYPFTLEALFAIGMSVGTDTYPKLIHLTYAVLLVLATFSFGGRYVPKNGGWIASAILVGMPIIPVWASLAYIDMGWSLYEFLGVFALIQWSQSGSRKWLVMTGMMSGLAIGSKYLAIGGAIVLGIWILWHEFPKGWRQLLSSMSIFGFVTLLIASPWLLKNLLWLGNPVYPFFESGISNIVSDSQSFSLSDYLFLPVDLFIHREKYAGVYGSIEFPSLLFLLVFILPWTRRTKPINNLAWITFLRYVFWALLSTHNRLRYLLPAFPSLSLLASFVIVDLSRRPTLKRLGSILFAGMIGGLVCITLIYSILWFIQVRPDRVILGSESKDSFLRRELGDYAAIQYIKSELPGNARVLMMWDPRGYYCDDRCLPDWLLNNWIDLVNKGQVIESVASALRNMGVTHLLLDLESLGYRIQYNPMANLDALNFFIDEFVAACTEEIFRDKWTIVYKFTCR